MYIPGMITGVHDGLWMGVGDVLPVHLLSWILHLLDDWRTVRPPT
jgi:hypothetical protein